MAITQRSYPEDFRPAYNEIAFSFSSTNVSECDFQYVADLYINGSFAVRLKAYPEGDNNYGYFRLEEFIQNYLSYNFQENLIGFAQNKQSICSYYLEIRERYNSSATCTGSSTLSSVQLTTSTRYAWNGALQYDEIPGYDQNRFLCNSSIGKFLTNSPERIKLPSDAYFNLAFLQDPDTPADHIAVLTYDRYDNLLNQFSIDNTFNLSSPDVPEDYHLSVGVGPAQLNLSTLSGGVQPVYDEHVHYYKVFLVDASSNQISEVKEFEIDNRCTKYDPYRLWFFNRLGGFDAYTFPLKYTRNSSINKTFLDKILGRGYALGDRGEKVIGVEARDAFVFNSNWLTEEEGLWIEELFTSPEVKLLVPESESGDEYEVSGVVHNGGFADFVLPNGVELSAGTFFSYEVDNGAPIGMASSGTGTILAYNSGSGRHETNVVSTINAGALITGTLIANYAQRDPYHLPVIVTNPSFEEKDTKIRYSVEAKPAFKKNIQRQ